MPLDDDMAGVLRVRWPSELDRAEELLDRAGIPCELVELYDGEEWELRVPRELAEAARRVLEALG